MREIRQERAHGWQQRQCSGATVRIREHQGDFFAWRSRGLVDVAVRVGGIVQIYRDGFQLRREADRPRRQHIQDRRAFARFGQFHPRQNPTRLADRPNILKARIGIQRQVEREIHRRFLARLRQVQNLFQFGGGERVTGLFDSRFSQVEVAGIEFGQ